METASIFRADFPMRIAAADFRRFGLTKNGRRIESGQITTKRRHALAAGVTREIVAIRRLGPVLAGAMQSTAPLEANSATQPTLDLRPKFRRPRGEELRAVVHGHSVPAACGGTAAEAAAFLEDKDTLSRSTKFACSGQARNAGADDENIAMSGIR